MIWRSQDGQRNITLSKVETDPKYTPFPFRNISLLDKNTHIDTTLPTEYRLKTHEIMNTVILNHSDEINFRLYGTGDVSGMIEILEVKIEFFGRTPPLYSFLDVYHSLYYFLNVRFFIDLHAGKIEYQIKGILDWIRAFQRVYREKARTHQTRDVCQEKPMEDLSSRNRRRDVLSKAVRRVDRQHTVSRQNSIYAFGLYKNLRSAII